MSDEPEQARRMTREERREHNRRAHEEARAAEKATDTAATERRKEEWARQKARRDASKLTPAGQFAVLIGLAALVAGLFIGFGLSASSIGVDGKSLQDLAAVHPVNCGTAFNPKWQSIACDNALSGRKVAAYALTIGGAVVAIGAGAVLRNKPDADPADPTGAA
jgi:hypothetical protein